MNLAKILAAIDCAPDDDVPEIAIAALQRLLCIGYDPMLKLLGKNDPDTLGELLAACEIYEFGEEEAPA